MLNVTITGLPEVEALFSELGRRVERLTAYAASEVANGMRDFVPVDTGFLRSTIHAEGPYAMADAPYAGYVAERTDFPGQAIDKLNEEALADQLMKGL